MPKIAPSVLSADFSNLGNEIKKVEAAGADWIHLDVMDGHFVPNISFGAPIIKAVRKITEIPFDTHLMISHPLDYVDDFADAGSDFITFHLECDDDTDKVIDKIHDKGVKAGISIKPKTEVKEIEKYLDKLELVLVMSVEPGFGGQKFMTETSDKVSELIKIRKEKNLNFLISIDGGITSETIALVSEADVAVAGSSVFRKEDYREAIAVLKV